MSQQASDSRLQNTDDAKRADEQAPAPGRASGWLDLHLRPFGLRSGRNNPFAHTGFLMQANSLRERLNERGSVTVIRGEPGMGRHALLDYVSRELHEPVHWLRLDIRLDQGLAAALEKCFPGSPDPGTALFETLGGTEAAPQQAVLVVDNAHLLGADDLDALLERLPAAAPRANTILLAEPGIERLISALAPEIAASLFTITVLPLRRNQLPDYIAHRLRAAGIHSPSPLGEPELRRIYRESGGVPGRINEVARKVLEELYNTEHSDLDYGRTTANPATTALLLSAALLLVTTGAWVWMQLEERDGGTAPDVGTTLAWSDPSSRAAPAVSDPAPVSTAAVTREPRSSPVGGGVRPAPAEPTSKVEPEVPSRIPAPQPLPQEPEPIPVAGGSDDAEKGPHGPQWLLDQPGDGFALQVVAARDLSAIERLCDSIGGCPRAGWYAIEREGTTWYRMLVGPYPTREDARAGIDELPPALRDQEPWVRRLSEIHGAISAGSRPSTAEN